MRKVLVLLMILCLMIAGCGGQESNEAPVENNEVTESAVVVQPLPDTTMDNLEDSTFAISADGGYLDDNGRLQMDVKIYSYDKYDMVDIAALEVGHKIVMHGEEVEVTSVEKLESGMVVINGGLEEGGFDLITDDSGVYFETGFNDAKTWNEVGEETIRVSTEFRMIDSSDLEAGEVEYFPGSFLDGTLVDCNFLPQDTTVRTEAGQIVYLEHIYMP